MIFTLAGGYMKDVKKDKIEIDIKTQPNTIEYTLISSKASA